MKRYHKKIYFPDTEKLQLFTSWNNSSKWKITNHAFDRIIEFNIMELKHIGNFINLIYLNHKDIFEYYTDDRGDIVKACYRINYLKENDLILVIGINKNLVTVYLNDKNDNHITLDKSIYQRG